jgi:hypothetical protein
MREDQINQAVRFLSDPRTQSASAQERQAFLKQKGLTEEEISAAYSRYRSMEKPHVQQPIYARPAFMDEPILWSAIKSIFSAVGAMAIGVVGYHAYASSTVNDKERSIPGRTDSPAFAMQEGLVTEDKLNEIIKEMEAKQELRHKEVMLALRNVSSSIENDSRVRKAGGSIVIPERTAKETDKVPEGPCDLPLVPEQVEREAVDFECEVQDAIDSGLDGTLLLILSSIESNSRLNKSNPRFNKLEGNKLLIAVGYHDRGEYFELSREDMDRSKSDAREIVEVIKRVRKAPVKTVGLPDAPIVEGFPSMPWIVNHE